MRFIFIILCSLLACSAQANETRHIKQVKIEIPHDYLNRSPTIDVYLKGKGPFKFLLDTGSSTSTISPELAQELGVKPDKTSPKSSTLTIDGIKYFYFSEMTDIYLGKNKILRRSRMAINMNNNANAKDGTIGLSTLFEAKIANDPDNARLTITLDGHKIACDPLKENSKCKFSFYDMPRIDVKLGGKKVEMLLDTGYGGKAPFVLFKSNFTNRIWTEYKHVLNKERSAAISDLPIGRAFTKDFVFNGTKECFADFYIKHPKDNSTKLAETVGTIGWWVIKDVAFEYDAKTRKLSYPHGACPYERINMIGIGARALLDDGDQAYIHNIIGGSPADIAGIVNFDILERVHLADGTVIEDLNEDFTSRLDDIMYAPEGTVVRFDVVREGKIVTIPVTSKGPFFLNLGDITK
jgi:Aspartyl protease